MKTKAINLYTFEELTPEQQEKCIEKHRDINDDTFELYAHDEAALLPIYEAGFNNIDIEYSLNYCQGDGAVFDCDDFNIDKLLKDWAYPHKNWIIDIIKKHCHCYIKKTSYANLYTHEKTRFFEIDFSAIAGQYPHIEHFMMTAEQHIEQLRYNLSINLRDDLYQQLEWLSDDEQIKETLIINEYYFNEFTLEIEN